DELRPVVRDDPRLDVGEPLPGTLDDLLDVRLGHGLTDLPVDDGPAVTVEQAAQVVERSPEVEVGDVYMPVVVGLQRLLEAGAFLGRLGLVALQQSGGLEDAVDAGGATGDDVRIEHHEGQTAVALEGKAVVEGEDGLLLVVPEPVVAWNPGVVLVDLAVAA